MKKINNGKMTKADFINFVKDLENDLINNPRKWENNTLELFLQALVAWTEDMDGYYKNQNIPLPQNVDWSVFANILMASTMYE